MEGWESHSKFTVKHTLLFVISSYIALTMPPTWSFALLSYNFMLFSQPKNIFPSLRLMKLKS